MRENRSIWTTDGCQTATLSFRYLKCICNVPGIIGAVTVPVLSQPETEVLGEEEEEIEEVEQIEDNIFNTESTDPFDMDIQNHVDLITSSISTTTVNRTLSNLFTSTTTSNGFTTSNIFLKNNNIHRRHLLYGGRFVSI